jgi:hypothetical protein
VSTPIYEPGRRGKIQYIRDGSVSDRKIQNKMPYKIIETTRCGASSL